MEAGEYASTANTFDGPPRPGGERFGAAVTSVALEVVLSMVLAGMILEAADDNAGAVTAGAALIVANGAVAAGALQRMDKILAVAMPKKMGRV